MINRLGMWSKYAWFPHFRTDKFPWFSSFFFPFSSVIFDEFNKYKNLFYKYTSIKKSEKNDQNVLTFPVF